MSMLILLWGTVIYVDLGRFTLGMRMCCLALEAMQQDINVFLLLTSNLIFGVNANDLG